MSFRFSRDKWYFLSAMVCGISMVFLDASILPVAIPTLSKELQISKVNSEWIVNVYFLAEAVFVILGGKLGDIFGIRRIYMLGLIIFGLSSVLGGLAFDELFLLIARAIQGFGAALIAPCMMALVVHKFPESQRGKAIGVMIAFGSLFLSLGPFIGGTLTQHVSWRWIFFINIFIALLGMLLTFLFVPAYKGKRIKIDFISLFFFATSLLLITLGTTEGDRAGWASYQSLALFIVGICFSYLFYRHYKKCKAKEPFFDFSLFRDGDFTIANTHVFITQFLLMNSVYWAIFFQVALEFSPTTAGFWTFISTLPVLITAPLAGYLSDKYGIKIPTTIGFSTIILAFCVLISYTVYQQFYLMLAGMILFGFSVSQILTPTGSLAISSVAKEKRGLASGIFYTMRFTGATLGMALLGSIYTASHKGELSEYISVFHPRANVKQQEDIRKIYIEGKEKSDYGYNVKEIQKKSSEGSFKALQGISILSLVLAFCGLCLVYWEKLKRKTTEIPL